MVIKTFIIDWPILILIGLIFGYGVKGRPEGSVFFTRAFGSGKFIVTLFVLIVYYSYVLAPDWMWMYYVANSDLPRWMVFYVLGLYYFAFFAGFSLTVEGRKMNRYYPPFLMVVMVLAELALIWGLRERYLAVGTFTDYIAGTTVPLAESAVGTTPMYLSLVLIPIGIGLLVWSRKQRFA